MILDEVQLKDYKQICPICKQSWIQKPEIKRLMTGEKNFLKAAYSFDSCYRVCEKDNIAISNGENPRIIFKNIESNLPDELNKSPEDVIKLRNLLINCINQKHTKSKENQFCFYRSEDAFTWAYFGYICKFNFLPFLQEKLQLVDKIESILFWGSPYFNISDIDFRDSLISVSDLYNENKTSRSEPDIVICTSKEILFIEVKIDSNNPRLSPIQKAKVQKYYNKKYYKDFDKASCLYELVRNWTLGNEMASQLHKAFKLINLMPRAKSDKERKSKYQIAFQDGIKNSENYKLLNWEDLFEGLENNYKKYLIERINSILRIK
ncbi:MAG: hypothetical protein IKX70_06250 [Treponema sp.]|nr:hypothetical protein [Treponema sp.]